MCSYMLILGPAEGSELFLLCNLFSCQKMNFMGNIPVRKGGRGGGREGDREREEGREEAGGGEQEPIRHCQSFSRLLRTQRPILYAESQRGD